MDVKTIAVIAIAFGILALTGCEESPAPGNPAPAATNPNTGSGGSGSPSGNGGGNEDPAPTTNPTPTETERRSVSIPKKMQGTWHAVDSTLIASVDATVVRYLRREYTGPESPVDNQNIVYVSRGTSTLELRLNGDRLTIDKDGTTKHPNLECLAYCNGSDEPGTTAGPTGGEPTVTEYPYFPKLAPITHKMRVGVRFERALPTAAGGAGGFTYEYRGNLPDGVRFDAETRKVLGTPTEPGIWDGTYSATDSKGVKTLGFILYEATVDQYFEKVRVTLTKAGADVLNPEVCRVDSGREYCYHSTQTFNVSYSYKPKTPSIVKAVDFSYRGLCNWYGSLYIGGIRNDGTFRYPETVTANILCSVDRTLPTPEWYDDAWDNFVGWIDVAVPPCTGTARSIEFC